MTALTRRSVLAAAPAAAVVPAYADNVRDHDVLTLERAVVTAWQTAIDADNARDLASVDGTADDLAAAKDACGAANAAKDALQRRLLATPVNSLDGVAMCLRRLLSSVRAGRADHDEAYALAALAYLGELLGEDQMTPLDPGAEAS